MNIPFESDNSRSVNIVFGIWKYCLTMPKYIYDPKTENYKYKKQKKRLLFCIVLFLMNLFENYLGYYNNKTHLEEIVYRFYQGILSAHTWISIIVANKCSGEIEKLLENLRILEIRKRKSPHKEFSTRNCYVLLWLLYASVTIFILIVCDVIIIYNSNPSPPNIFIAFMFYFHLTLSLQVQQFYITILSILSHHSKILSNSFKSMELSYFEIHDMEKYHQLVITTNSEFYRTFAIAILVKCLHIFSSILTSLFAELNSDLYQDSISLYVAVRVFSVCWFVCDVAIMLVMIWHNMEIEEEGKCTNANIYQIRTYIGRDKLPYKSMELFLLNSKLNKLKFSVYGFFALDWTLIYSMVGAITAYLVFLVQFREMEQSRSSVM